MDGELRDALANLSLLLLIINKNKKKAMYPVYGRQLQAPILKEDIICRARFTYPSYTFDLYEREIDFQSKEYSVIHYARRLTSEERALSSQTSQKRTPVVSDSQVSSST